MTAEGRSQAAFDVGRITAEVAAKHGVLLKPDDPAMVLVTINQYVLENCFARLEHRARALIKEMEAASEYMADGAAGRLADQVRQSGVAIREEVQRDIELARLELSEAVFKIRASYLKGAVERAIAIGMVCAVGLLVFGIALGFALSRIL
jgi:hypothetical protein